MEKDEIEKAIQKEREACANLLLHCNLSGLNGFPEIQGFIANICNEVAKAIMARGNKNET